MGDPRRNTIFTDFIFRNYPKAKSILVVADGKGELAHSLTEKGFRVRVIEKSPRNKFAGINYCKGTFREYRDKVSEELIVGMHPDEATPEIIKAARTNAINFAVVPCCIKADGCENHGVNGYTGWLKRLSELFLPREVYRTQLRFSGKNIVLFSRINS